ncbi:MAG: alkaline phosphatase family protein [Candidatus Njordarchaeia archaeon]
MDITLPDYNKVIFKVVPTIFSECLKIDIDEPYSRYVFREKKLLDCFNEADINLVLIIDSICKKALYGFLFEKWVETGKITLSSVVPSTSGNAVGSIYIGLPPEISGLIAMRFYLPEIGNFINALYGKAIDDALVPLSAAGVKLSNLLWEKPILDVYAKDDIVFVDLLPNFIRGGLENFYNGNLVTLHFETDNDSVYEVRGIVERFMEKNLRGIIFLYYHHLDSISHKYGYKSEEWKSELGNLNTLVEKIVTFLSSLVKKYGKNVNIFVVSDHGHIQIDETIRIRNDEWENFARKNGIKSFLQSDRFGFFYVERSDNSSELVEKLKSFFGNNAIILGINEAIDLGFWPDVKQYNTDKFLQRAGQIVLVTKGNKSIKVEKEDAKDNIFYNLGNEFRELMGRHGGMTEEEMIVPFIPINLE